MLFPAHGTVSMAEEPVIQRQVIPTRTKGKMSRNGLPRSVAFVPPWLSKDLEMPPSLQEAAEPDWPPKACKLSSQQVVLGAFRTAEAVRSPHRHRAPVAGWGARPVCPAGIRDNVVVHSLLLWALGIKLRSSGSWGRWMLLPTQASSPARNILEG